MRILDKSKYNLTTSWFNNIGGSDVTVNSIRLGEIGNIFVNDNDDFYSSYIQTNYGFHFLGGEYDSEFMLQVYDYIMDEIVPEQKLHPYMFLFGNDDLWLKAIEDRFSKLNGRYIDRLYYHLNKERFFSNEDQHNQLPEGYTVKRVDDPEIEVKFVVYDHGEEIGTCCNGARGKYADIDMFIHEDYRYKGIGVCLGTHFIRYCLDNGYELRGGSWIINEPSVKVAKKMGFDVVMTTKGYICEIPGK